MLKPHTALLALTALLGTAAAHAVTIVPAAGGGAQSTSTQVFHGIYGGPTHPPLTPSGQVQSYQVLTPGTSPVQPGLNPLYVDGEGIASEATVQGPARFVGDLVQPFQAHAWAVASARSGYLATQTSGTSIEHFRLLPQPDGSRKPQVDSVWATSAASANTTNYWNLVLNRDAAGQVASRPLTFGLTLAVDTTHALNPANIAGFNPIPSNQGSTTLEVTLHFNRLLNLGGGPLPATLADGGPPVISQTHQFTWNESQQGPQTLRIEQTLSELTQLWSAPGQGNSFTLDGSGDLRARTCLDFRAGFFWDDFCSMHMRVDMRLSTSPGLNLAEANVSATWDATVDGDTDALKRITTTAAYWGEPLPPLITTRPSMATPVPEAGVWWMVLAGLGVVAWRQRRASPGPGPSGQPQLS
jgi:hypothetical protein